MKKSLFTLFILTLVTPLITNAQFGWSISIGIRPNNVSDLVWMFLNFLNLLIPVIVGLAVLLFIWGLVRYYASDGEDTKKQALRIIGYGIVSIFVMVSIWGIINFISDSTGIRDNDSCWGILCEKPIPKKIPTIDTEIIKPQP